MAADSASGAGNVYVVETDGIFGAIQKALSDHELIEKVRKQNAALQVQYQKCHEDMQTYYAQASALSRENQSLKATVKDLQARLSAAAGNVYVMETDGLWDAGKKAVFGKDNVELKAQVQGLKAQKKDLLAAVDGAVSEVHRVVAELQSKAQAVKNVSGNEQYTENKKEYDKLYVYADAEHEAFEQVYRAYQVVKRAYDLLFANTVEFVSTDLKTKLQDMITEAEDLVQKTTPLKTNPAVRGRV